MRHAAIFWFTGLSGSGKTTVASGVKLLLEADGYSVLVLDGDEIRSRVHTRLGFTEADIKENNRRIAELCRQDRDKYDVIIVAIISPYESSRQEARAFLGEPFAEVYLSADLETVTRRDSKGLYARAARGEIENVIGYSPSAPYEPPHAADLVIDTAAEGPERCVRNLYGFATDRLKAHAAR